jgi:uncharacterized membrane protein
MYRTWIIMLMVFTVASCGEKQDPFSGDSGVNEDVTYTKEIKPILDTNCTGCHASDKQGADRNGAPVGINFDTYADAKANATRANSRIQAGTMPPGGSALSVEDKAFFQTWLDKGLKE